MYKDVGLPNAAAVEIGCQSAAQDERGRLGDGGRGRRLQRGRASACRYAGISVQAQEIGHHRDLEQTTPLEAALKNWGDWSQFSRDEYVVLRSHRALLGKVSALRGHP
jgi:hypothetical protein